MSPAEFVHLYTSHSGPVPNGTLNPRHLPLSLHFSDVMLLRLGKSAHQMTNGTPYMNTSALEVCHLGRGLSVVLCSSLQGKITNFSIELFPRDVNL